MRENKEADGTDESGGVCGGGWMMATGPGNPCRHRGRVLGGWMDGADISGDPA